MATDTRILEINGELDMHHTQAVRDQLTTLVSAKPARLLVDLSNLTYIDSSGLALLIETHQRLREHAGRLGLFGLRENVRHIFEIARLDQVFQLFADKTAALAAV